MAKSADTSVSRIRTLYEQMVPNQFESPIEDDQYRYITVPASDEDRIVEFFRRGYEPAEDHPQNDAKRVTLRIDKRAHTEKYLKASAFLKSILNEKDKESGTFKGAPLSQVAEGRPMTASELRDSLPETDPDQ